MKYIMDYLRKNLIKSGKNDGVNTNIFYEQYQQVKGISIVHLNGKRLL